jgi:hypothetical protein
VTALSREWSDHTPMLIDTGIGCVKLFHFKLELCWLTREDVMDVVRPVWEVDASNRTPIEEWSRNVDNIFRKEKRLSELLDSLDKADEDNGWNMVGMEFYFETKKAFE